MLAITAAVAIKSSPLDIETFHQEISIKYPTFSNPPPAPSLPSLSVNSNPTSGFSSPSTTSLSSSFSNIHSPQPTTPVPTNKLSEAYTPIPVRHHYHHDDPDPASMPGGMSMSHFQQMQLQQQQQSNNGGGFRGLPQPGTPAPTPPPSPKPKKQQYQTDPTRPFLFPFSRKSIRGRDMMLVPFAIEEADRLYNRHMYVSASLWQIWKTREECITAESGLDHLRPDGDHLTQGQAEANARKSVQVRWYWWGVWLSVVASCLELKGRMPMRIDRRWSRRGGGRTSRCCALGRENRGGRSRDEDSRNRKREEISQATEGGLDAFEAGRANLRTYYGHLPSLLMRITYLLTVLIKHRVPSYQSWVTGHLPH